MNDHSPTHDLVIVGASFAGLIAAKTAAMRGLKVVVLESKPDAGHRVHTTGILVKEAAEDVDIPHFLTRRVHGVRLYAPNLRHIDLFSPGYFFLTTDTANLLRWLADDARRAGAELRFSARFLGAERSGPNFILPATDITARYIIGADGAKSAVARTFGLGRNQRFLTGLEAEYEGLGMDQRFLHCFIDSKSAPGYLAWVAPGPSISQVGMAASKGRTPLLKSFERRTRGIFDYTDAIAVERRAGRIPCGGLVKPWASAGVMLIGDAAGQVSPATGGGIRLAFRYGRKAAQAVADHLQNLGPPPEMVLAADLPHFGIKSLFRRTLDLAPPNWLINMALSTPPMQFAAQRIYFHRRGNSSMSFAEYSRAVEQLGQSAVSMPKAQDDVC